MKKTQLGISSFSYPFAVGVKGYEPKHKMSEKELVDEAAALQVPVLQLGDNFPLEELSEVKLKELADYAEERGIKLEVGMRGLTENRINQYLKIADILKANLLRIVIDYNEYEPDFDTIVDIIKRVLPELEKRKCILGIENHDRLSAREFADIVRAADSAYVGIVLDTVNSFACEENTKEVMKELADYTVCFHVKDYKIKRIKNAMGLEVTGTIAGQGFLNIPEMIDELKLRAKNDFSTILELWMHPEESVGETLEKEKLWVEKSITFLKDCLKDEKED